MFNLLFFQIFLKAENYYLEEHDNHFESIKKLDEYVNAKSQNIKLTELICSEYSGGIRLDNTKDVAILFYCVVCKERLALMAYKENRIRNSLNSFHFCNLELNSLLPDVSKDVKDQNIFFGMWAKYFFYEIDVIFNKNLEDSIAQYEILYKKAINSGIEDDAYLYNGLINTINALKIETEKIFTYSTQEHPYKFYCEILALIKTFMMSRIQNFIDILGC